MLVREDGNRLILAQAAPQHWLANGKQVAVLDAPTHFGKVSYTIDSHADQGRIAVKLDPPKRKPPKAIVLFKTPEGRTIPAIEPVRQPCLLCTDVPCATACPEGALVPPDNAAAVRIGIARVNPRTCVTFKGQVCDECFQACPYPHAAIMKIGGRPLVGSGACTGCGLCEKACPERPRAIAVIPERHLVPGLRVPKGEVPSG